MSKGNRKKALIIGGGSDIGAAIVHEFARSPESYEVVWTYFNSNRVDMPGVSIKCDITDISELQKLFVHV